MSDILVRRLDPAIKERLKLRAKANRRSLEAEARNILEAAVSDGSGEAPAGKQPLGERLKSIIGKSALTSVEWAEFDRSIAADRADWQMRRLDFNE